MLLLRRWQLLYGGRERLLLVPRGAHQQQLQLLLLHHKLPQRLVPVWQLLLLLLCGLLPVWHVLLLLQRGNI